MVHTQFNRKIQILRSDNGGEYVNLNMQTFFQANGLIHQTSCSHTPQQNGVAERKNRILLEMTRALIIESHVPKSFWPEAVATAVYLSNRLPTKILDHKTPLQILETQNQIPPGLTLPPRIFGCTVFVHVPKADRSKLDPCALKCVFVGYALHQKGYRCYNPSTRRIHVTMDCTFLESDFYYSVPPSAQGESSHGSLGWLVYPEPYPESSGPESSKPSQIVTETETVSPPVESLVNLEKTIVQSSAINESSLDDVQQEVSDNELHISNDESIDETNRGDGRYILPRRSNRGVPPNRYSPEHLPRSSRYPVGNLVRGSVSEAGRVFATILYDEEIP